MRVDLSDGITPASTRVMNLSHFLTDIARRHPDAPGFVWGERTWSWAQMEARAAAFAEVLIQRFGARKGDRILVQSANNNQMFEAMFGSWRAGCVWVPANFRQTPEDVAFLAQSSQARGMLVGAEFAAHAAACAPSLDFTIAIGAADFAPDYEGLIAPYLGQARPAVAVQRADQCGLVAGEAVGEDGGGHRGHPAVAVGQGVEQVAVEVDVERVIAEPVGVE